MTSPENSFPCDSAGPRIGNKQLWQATYLALALFVLVGLVAFPFQDALSQWLGNYLVVAYMVVAAIIMMVCNMSLMHMMHRRTSPMTEKSHAIASLKSTQIGLMIDSHLRLDEAISTQLKGAVSETESAAMMLIVRVRSISDAANMLVTKLNSDNINDLDKQQEIEACVVFIAKMDKFLQELSGMIRQDNDVIHHVGKAIDDLVHQVNGMAEISAQIDLLANHASREAISAGEYGQGFVAVADSAQKISEQYAKASSVIESNLAEIQQRMQINLNFSFLEECSQRVSDASNIIESIRNLHSGYEDMRQHNKGLLDEVGSYSASLAVDVAEIFGQVQFQDVVRQRIERVEIAVAERNALFQDIAQAIDDPNASLVDLQVKMRAVLDQYLAIEHLHAPAFSNAPTQGASVTKIELF